MNKFTGWVLILGVLFLPACGLLSPGGNERIAQDAAQFQPIVERAKQDLAAGVPWYQRSAELLIGLTTALGTAGGVIGTRVLRGPADKAGKLKVAAERAAKVA